MLSSRRLIRHIVSFSLFLTRSPLVIAAAGLSFGSVPPIVSAFSSCSLGTTPPSSLMAARQVGTGSSRPPQTDIVDCRPSRCIDPRHLQPSPHRGRPVPSFRPLCVSRTNGDEAGKNKNGKEIQEVEPPSRVFKIIAAFARSLLRGMSMPLPLRYNMEKRDGFIEKDQGTRNRTMTEQGKKHGTNRAEEKKPITLSFTVRECALSIGAYLLIGVFCYSMIFEHWSITDALYFSVTTFTTVGYGDLSPTTVGGRFFTAVFGIGGVLFLGAALASIGANLVEAEVAALDAARKASRRSVLGVFDHMPHVLERFRTNGHNNNATSFVNTTEVLDMLNVTATAEEKSSSLSVVANPKPWWTTLRRIALKYVPIYSLLFLGGVMIGRLEGWAWLDSIYYAIITSTTVGYGDFSPRTHMGRLWAVLFVPLSVAAAGEILGSVASYILERRRARFYHGLVDKELTVEDLQEMDEDKNGEVSRLEYVEFMLLKMNMVDRGVLDELHEQFDRLDVTQSDTISKADLELLAALRKKEKILESLQLM